MDLMQQARNSPLEWREISGTPATNTIAVFDFDGTLVIGDSFFPFLGFLSGWHNLAFCLGSSVALYLALKWKNKKDPRIADHRTFIKDRLLKKLVAGRAVTALPPVLAKLSRWQKGNPSIYQALKEHHAAGHRIVVASGGLDLYLSHLLKDLPIDGLICTKVGIENGVMTGEMTNGNCVRARKAELVAEYINQHGPFTESWGYGNAPHDLPMLALLHHRILV